MMKWKIKCASVLLTLVLLASLVVYAADSVSYTLDDVGLSISLPSDYIVFTRDLSEADPDLSTYGLTKEGMSSLMISKGIYLDAWPKSIDYEIVVIMAGNTAQDFNLYGDDGLRQMAEYLSTQYKTIGITCEKHEIYRHDQTKFMKLYIDQLNGDDMVYGLQYYTVYNSKPISVTIQSYSGEITAQNEKLLTEIVDSVVFDAALQTVGTHVTSGVYTDPETQTTFTVPENWTESPLSKPREFIDAKFICDEDNLMMIMYGSYDAFNALPESERAGLTRSDLDGAQLTQDFAAEMFGISPDEVSVVAYGGNNYFKMNATTTDSSYGTEISLTMTQLLYVDNGYIYSYQFSGTDDSEYYSDFEALMNSVEYKDQAVTGVSAIPDNTGFANAYDLGVMVLSLLITITIYSMPIMIYRYGIKKAPVEVKKAKRITIIYGIFAFIAMAALMYSLGASEASGGAILLWSFINYRILTGGKKAQLAGESDGPEEVAGNAEPPNESSQESADAGAYSDDSAHALKGMTFMLDKRQNQTRR